MIDDLKTVHLSFRVLREEVLEVRDALLIAHIKSIAVQLSIVNS